MARLDPLSRSAVAVALFAGLLAAPTQAQRAPTAPVSPARTPQPSPASPTAAPPTPASLEATLRSLSLDPLCDVEGAAIFRCEARATPPGSAESLRVRVTANGETRTVFLSVPELARAAPDAAETPALLRRLAELNWELLLGKLEWNAATGEVRLTMVLPTHGGLDRDALGAMVRALVALAGRLGPVLRAAAPR